MTVKCRPPAFVENRELVLTNQSFLMHVAVTNGANLKATNDSDSVYMAQLKRLNKEVCDWMVKHVNDNPYIDLSPVFRDYQKHLSDLEKKFPAETKSMDGFETSILIPNAINSLRGPSTSVGVPTTTGSTF